MSCFIWIFQRRFCVSDNLIYKWKCDSARNGNLRGWAGLWELVRQKYKIQIQNSRWDNLNYMHPVKSLEKTDGVEEGFHCGIVKLRNQETKMSLFAVHPTGLSVFQAQCFEHNALRHNVCTPSLPGWNPCWLWDVPHSFPVASTLGSSARIYVYTSDCLESSFWMWCVIL